MPDVEVDNVARIGFLYTNSERIGGMEGECDQVTRRGWRRWSTHNSGAHAKPQQSGIANVETDGVLAAVFRPLHQRHPFVVVGEELKVQIRRARVGLS